MKKLLLVMAACLAAFLLSGCGSTSKVAAASAEPAPDWVLNEAKASDGANWYAVGSAKMPTEQNSLKMARMQARAELARIVNTQVNDAITAKSRMNNAGLEEKELVETMHFSAEALLEGSEQIGRYTAPGGTVYVLMALPKANALQKLNEGGGKSLFSLEDLK